LNSWCTGCELCIAPCPVDCISMVKAVPEHIWDEADAALARERYYGRNARLAHDAQKREARLAAKTTSSAVPSVATQVDPALLAAEARKKAIIAAAIERARLQRDAVQPQNTAPASEEVKRQIAETEARRARLGSGRKDST
jgi:electron transport complex protein RnfB